MKKFKDLVFKEHTTGPGLHAVMLFENGYGVSVVRWKYKIPGLSERYGSYTSNENEWELAVIYGTSENDWSLCYTTKITDDVLGHLSNEEVSSVMEKVQKL